MFFPVTELKSYKVIVAERSTGIVLNHSDLSRRDRNRGGDDHYRIFSNLELARKYAKQFNRQPEIEIEIAIYDPENNCLEVF